MSYPFNNKIKRTNWTREERQEVVELNNNNVPISEIAKRYKGRDSKAIINVLGRLGWKINNRN
jgi:hypothetical protein